MKEYRQNSHTFSLVLWTVLCSATAAVLFVHSHRIVNRLLKVEEILAGFALLIFGPAALAAYLIRAQRVWVSINPARGLLLSGRRTIAWEDVIEVRRQRPSFRKGSGPAEVASMNLNPADINPGGCVDPGCFEGFGVIVGVFLLIVAAISAVWLIFFVFVPVIVVPVLEVFAPFGDRITVITRRGRFVFRDLRGADEFMREVSEHRPVAVDS